MALDGGLLRAHECHHHPCWTGLLEFLVAANRRCGQAADVRQQRPRCLEWVKWCACSRNQINADNGDRPSGNGKQAARLLESG
jgi:hypothetical protein